MDDMKKLVEKYKRELMEYSRTAAKPEKQSSPSCHCAVGKMLDFFKR